ncbi:MAG: 2-hydroxychromene-2-carboxylate isomerase [Deltaproteobacteria bacterium]|nr:2-hydroxychromene-2-carboxylate isomerase [Deltaproteobacteria bacterium]
MKKVVELFWDVASPYTYLAHTQMAGLEARTGAEVQYRPFLLGGVFKSTDNLMPGANPYKAAYLVKDLARWRDHYQVPMKMPALEVIFPLSSLLPMRLATAADLAGQGRTLATAFFQAYWVQGRNVGEESEARGVVEEAGLDAAALFAAAQTGPVKDRLRANTEEAVSRGAFGAPAIFVGDQLYFGNDRLMFVEAALRG